MPFLKQKNIGPGNQIGIWHITEKSEELFNQLSPNPADSEQYAKINYPDQQRQWLAARLLIRQLTQSKASITYDEFGKPFLADQSNHISISHAFEYVAIQVNKERATGIDIELIRDKISRIAPKFMHQEELANIDPERGIEQLHVYWGAKEALYKAYGEKRLIFAENIHIAPFQYNGAGIIEGSVQTKDYQQNFVLQYEKFNTYMLVYIIK